MENKKEYTVKQLAGLAGISPRTLHHYDQIGLLKPGKRTDAGYRLYKDKDLLKLQQILFYRELDFPLDEIKRVLGKKGFDMVHALEKHKTMLQERNKRTETLIKTIDKTINSLKETKTMLKDEELYEGFSKEEIESIKKEVNEKYDPKLVAESNRRVRSMSKEQWAEVKKEGGDIYSALGDAFGNGLSPDSKETQALIARHYQHLHRFYTPNPEMYKGLGEMYVADERFRAFYDKIRPNLADYIKKAIDIYCEKTLK